MKLSLRFFLFLFGTISLLHSQDGISGVSSESSNSPASSARILGEIPDGSPPPIAPPKPELVVSPSDVLKATAHEQGGRTITIRQIKPIPLPPPPPPAEETSGEADAAFAQNLAEYREENPKSGLLLLGATVFRSKDSPPRTLVRYWPEGGHKDITFWSSADFALIAGGINTFVDSAGDSHHILMGWGNVDMDYMAEVNAAKGREYDAPELPGFTENIAAFRTTEELPAAEDLVAIQSLHDIYNKNLAQLKVAYEGRERARIKREEDLKLHPPTAKDITLNYWRTEKPTVDRKGAVK